MRLPQDMANLLAVAIRDVIWFKNNVRAFLKDCGVPKQILDDVMGAQLQQPTIRIVHQILDRLDALGDEGGRAIQSMLTKMYYWKDFHTIPADRRDVAITSLKALQEAHKKYEAQRKYQQEQERKMHLERVERSRMSDLDHARLQAFRDEFDQIHAIADRQERGNRFQNLMNRLFDYYAERSEGPFRRTGEQIDSLFYFDKHWYYVEIRWTEEKATAADISVLRDRAKAAFGGDTKALFISFNGFSSECLESLAGKDDERVILMNGVDLHDVLDCIIAFDVLLAEKQADIVQNKRPFISVRDILARRK